MAGDPADVIEGESGSGGGSLLGAAAGIASGLPPLAISPSSGAQSGQASQGFNQTIGGLSVNKESPLLWAVVAVVVLVIGWLLWQQLK